jgi:predicted pyridoxine 5'-phosphate oxidase superfamily flavin-nucleotide-binding protein
MLTDTVRSFLQKPRIAYVSTIAPDGYPHTVPVWFDVDGDDLVIIAVRSTRKIAHALANPKGAITIGGNPDDGGGFLFRGDWSVEPDTDDQWTVRLCHRYEAPERAARDIEAWADLDIVLLRLKVKSVSKVA